MHSRGSWSLRVRLLIAVTIALLPIAVASFIQGMDRVERDTINIRERLVQTTRASASSEENMLASADQIVRALANMPAVQAGGEGCNQALADALHGLMFFVNITRIDAAGRVTCAAVPASVGRNVAFRDVFKRARSSGDFVISEKIESPVLKRPIILGMLPLTRNNRFDGTIGISLDTRWLDYMVHAKRLPQDAAVAIFDSHGAVIATNRPDVAAHLFTAADAEHTTGADLHMAQGPHGDTWLYSTASLLGSRVYVGFAMPQSKLFGATYVHVGTDFVLPFVMIALTWIAIWIVTEQQVTRWIVYLRRVAAAYRGGHYGLRPALGDAPTEFQLLGTAMAEMAGAIQDRDHRLRDALDQKSLLIREIHHRVKNNLQIVMSLLSLQAGRLEDVAAQEALRQARTRINALALVHRILHDIEDLTTVELGKLFHDLAAQVFEGFAVDHEGFSLEVETVERHVSGDLAVPLALFTVEALTNVFKHAYPERVRSGTIRLTLRQDGPMLRLAIADDGRGYALDPASNSVGAKLIRTFAAQVGGAVSMHSSANAGTVVELCFPDPDVAARPPLAIAAD